MVHKERSSTRRQRPWYAPPARVCPDRGTPAHVSIQRPRGDGLLSRSRYPRRARAVGVRLTDTGAVRQPPVCGPRHRSHPPPPGGGGGATSRPPPRGQFGTTGAVSLLGTGLLLLAGFRRLVPNAPNARPRLLRSTLWTPASCRPRRYPGSPFMATPRTQPPRSALGVRRNVAWGEGAIEGWVPLGRQRRLGLGQARLRSEVPPCTHWAAGAVRASRDLGLPGCRTRRRRRSQPFLAQTGPGARHCVMWVIS